MGPVSLIGAVCCLYDSVMYNCTCSGSVRASGQYKYWVNPRFRKSCEAIQHLMSNWWIVRLYRVGTHMCVSVVITLNVWSYLLKVTWISIKLIPWINIIWCVYFLSQLITCDKYNFINGYMLFETFVQSRRFLGSVVHFDLIFNFFYSYCEWFWRVIVCWTHESYCVVPSLFFY